MAYDIGTATGMSKSEIASGLKYTEFRSKFAGGAHGGPKLYPYNAYAEETITPTISETITTGFTLITALDYTKFQMQSSRESYIYTSSGYYKSAAPSGCGVETVRSFMFNGDVIEFLFRYTTGHANVFVDGELKSSFTLTSALNSPRYFSLDLGSAKLRRIDVVCRQEYWGGISYDADNYYVYKTRDSKQSIAVLGDSYTNGTGVTDGMTFVANLRWKLDSWDIANYGIGGSGYINDTSSGQFINRIQETYDAGHDYLMVCGGINDLNSSTSSEFQTAVDEFYEEAISIGYFTDKIIIVSLWQSGTYTASYDSDGKVMLFNAILRAKADELGCLFIDSVGLSEDDAWFYGSGYVGAETEEGNSDIMTSSDSTHPTSSGHLLIGHNLACCLLDSECIY